MSNSDSSACIDFLHIVSLLVVFKNFPLSLFAVDFLYHTVEIGRAGILVGTDRLDHL